MDEKTVSAADAKNCAENNDATIKTESGRHKFTVHIIVGICAALMIAALVVIWQFDRVVAASIRTVGSQITGTQVDVSSVSIKPFAGAVKVEGFKVGNPEGFQNPHAIAVGKFHVKLNIGSVFTDKIEIEHLELSGVAIDFEYNFSKGSNLDVILKNVEKFAGTDNRKSEDDSKKDPADDAEEKTQKKVVIRKLIFNDSKVTVSSKLFRSSLPLPLAPIEMENVGDGKSLGETISDILKRIVTEIGKVVDFNKIGSSISDTTKELWNKLPGFGSK